MQIAIEKKQLLATGSHEKSEPLKKIMKRNRRVTDRPTDQNWHVRETRGHFNQGAI